jgi:hypothetical protein
MQQSAFLRQLIADVAYWILFLKKGLKEQLRGFPQKRQREPNRPLR